MANDNHGQAHGEHGHHSARMYYVTYLVLATCTILTYTAAQHDFGTWSFAIAMLIAVIKASFVVLFFMHLWDQRGTSRLTMAISVVFVLLLITLTISDAETRFPLAMPPGSHRALHIGHNPFPNP